MGLNRNIGDDPIMMYILTFLIISIIFFFIPIFATDKKKINEQTEKQNKVHRLIEDNVIVKSKSYINNEYSKAIVIDEQNKKVHLFSYYNCYTYSYDDIIESEVVIDNTTITSTNRGKQILGSVVGGVIAGVPGMIIGGLSNEQTSMDKIKSMELKLTLNDMDNVIYQINFLTPTNNGLSKDSPQVKKAISDIDKWHGIFNIILKHQNKAI